MLKRAVRIALLAGVPLAALAVAFLATRSSDTKPPSTADVDHSQHGASPTASAAQPVMLTADQARRIGVTYAVAEMTPLEREIRTVGEVTYDETGVSAVALKIDGWVERLYVNFTGQAVSRGTPLMSIYSPMLVTAQEELLLAKRLEAEVARGSADARENAASLLESARRRLSYWDIPDAEVARIEQSGQVQRAITLRAPVSGFVVEKNVLQGQRVMAGDALYRIADLATVWVEGEVFERDLPSVRLGQRVTVQLDALPGRALTGRITYIYPTLNTETRTSRVRVALANPGMLLKPGMYATLIWSGSAVVSALSVPRTAVISTGQRNLVFVRRADGMLEPRVVDVGIATDERVQILNGLLPGDSVVRSATFLLDAESNLRTLLGGMGDMPGMDMTAPRARVDTGGADAHKSH
jgi:RND family efflux transporter MFP subunit